MKVTEIQFTEMQFSALLNVASDPSGRGSESKDHKMSKHVVQYAFCLKKFRECPSKTPQCSICGALPR